MTNQIEVSSLHAFIEGHVQGVGFRFFVKEAAENLGINGWVRNLYNGSVEVIAEGERESLEQLLQLLRKGPGRSMVTDIQFDWSTTIPKYSQFSFLPTE